MDPLSLIGLIASSVALVGTATNITKGFHVLISHYKDIPRCINDLFHEHKLVETCLENFQKFLESNQNDPDDDVVAGIRNQAHAAVSETQKTLDELHGKIQRFLPKSQSAIRRATVRIGLKYAWNERSLQAIMHRLQTRRNALSVIMQLWSTNDAAMLRRQISALQATLQGCLMDLRKPDPILDSAQVSCPDADTTSPADVQQPVDENKEVDNDDGASSTSSAETNSTTLTMPHGPTTGERFIKAIAKGHVSGPGGDAVQRRLRHLNAVKEVVLHETAPSGLCGPESAAALSDLAKAYQDIEDYGTALEYHHEALIAREQALGPAHQTTLNTLDSIASLFELAGLWDYALAYWLQSLEGRLDSAKFGENHPTTLAARLRTARAKSMVGNHGEALSDLAGLLSFYEAASRGGGTDSMRVRWEKARVQTCQGEYEEALEGYRTLLPEYATLAASRRDNPKLGPQDPRTREADEAVADLNREIATVDQLLLETSGLELSALVLAQPSSKSGRDGHSVASSSSARVPATSSDSPSTLPSLAEDSSDSLVIRAYHEKLKQVREKKGNLHPDTLELMCDLAGAYASHEKHALAIGWYKEALKGQERALPAGHPVVAATVFQMAESYTEMGDLRTALSHFQRALTDREARFPRDHPETLAVLLAIGSIYASNEFEDFPQAMQLVKRAADGFAAKFGPLHNDTLNAQFQMAQIHVRRGHYSQGIQLHELVLRQRTTKRGENHHITLMSKSCLAQAYSKNGERTKAIALWTEVLRGRERTLGRTHSSTTLVAEQLAILFWNSDDWRKALPHFMWVLEGIQHEQPNCEAATMEALDNIAQCHWMLDEYETALDWFRKLLAIRERHSGPSHADTVQVMQNVARLCSMTERPTEAISLFHKILAIREQTLPDTHKDVSILLLYLSRCSFDADQREECLFWTARLLAIPEDENITGEQRMAAQRRVGLVYILEKQPEQASEVYQSLLEEARVRLPADHWILQSATKELGIAHLMSMEQVDAVIDLARQRERARRLLDTDKPSAIVMLSGLAGAHLKENEYSEAAAMYEEVIDLIEELETRRLLKAEVVDPNDDDDDELDLTFLKHNAISELADAHLALANHEKALSLLSLLAGSEQVRCFRHGALVRLADLREETGEYTQALETWNLLLGEIRRGGAGGDSSEGSDGMSGPFDELRTMRRIAILQLRMGDPAEALRWGNGILKGFRNLALDEPAPSRQAERPSACGTDSESEEDEGDDSPSLQVLRTQDFLADVNWSLGNYEEGIAAGREAAEGFEQQLGAAHKLTLNAALSLAEMYAMLERRPQALTWYNKALTGYQDEISRQHPKMQDGESRRVEKLAQKLGVLQNVQ